MSGNIFTKAITTIASLFYKENIGEFMRKSQGVGNAFKKANYTELVEEGYKKSRDVYCCVTKIARRASNIPYIVYSTRPNGEIVEELSTTFQDVMKEPNPTTRNSMFIEEAVTQLLIAGNIFIYGIRIGGAIREVHCLRPDRITVEYTADRKEIAYYVYKDENNDDMEIDVEDMLHIKYYNPLNEEDVLGLSPLQVGMVSARSSNAGKKWNYNFLYNNATPPGVLYLNDDKKFGDNQKKEIMKKFYNRYAGISNAGVPIVLQGNWKYEKMMVSARDMQYAELLKLSAIDIYSIYAMPPELVGYPEHKTYNNVKEAKKAMITDAVEPPMMKILNEILDWIHAGEDLNVKMDRSQVPEMQEDRDAVYKRSLEAFTKGILTRNEARKEIGYGVTTDKGEEFYMPQNILPINLLANPQAADDVNDDADEAGGETDDADDEGAEDKKSADDVNDDAEKKNEKNRSLTVSGENAIDPPRKQKGEMLNFLEKGVSSNASKVSAQEIYVIMEKLREKNFKKFDPEVQKTLETEFKGITSVAAKAKSIEGLKARINGFIDTESPKLWLKQLTAIYVTVGVNVYEKLWKDQKAVNMESWQEYVSYWLEENAGDKITKITETTRNIAMKTVSTGVEAGLGVPELAKELSEKVGFTRYRSTVITRTEVIGSSNCANQANAKVFKVPLMKIWRSSGDKQTRPAHKAADGQTQEMNDPYVVDGEKLMYPGDSSMGCSGSNVIMCRCYEVYVNKE